MTLRAALCAAVLLALAPPVALAHPLLLDASPAPNATLPSAPHELTLRFNNRIEKRLSHVRLVDAQGVARPLDVTVGAGTPDRLVAVLPPLGPGTYRVDWQVLSADGHVVSGSFAFRLAP